MMQLLGVYMDLPAWVRMLIAVVVLGLGIYMTVFGYRGRQVLRREQLPDGNSYAVEAQREHPYADLLFFTGIGTCAVGAMLVTACGTSDAEQHGYKF
jgi:hypothetical protein